MQSKLGNTIVYKQAHRKYEYKVTIIRTGEKDMSTSTNQQKSHTIYKGKTQQKFGKVFSEQHFLAYLKVSFDS